MFCAYKTHVKEKSTRDDSVIPQAFFYYLNLEVWALWSLAKSSSIVFHSVSAVPVLEVAVEEVAELVVLIVTLVVLVVVWVTVDRVELVDDVIVTVTPDTPKPSEFSHANTKATTEASSLQIL